MRAYQTLGMVSLCFLLPVAAPALEQTEYGWFGHASLGGVVTKGNTDTSSLNAALQQKYRSKQWGHKIDLSVLDTRDQGNATTQRYVGSYRVIHRYRPVHEFFIDLRMMVDEFSGYDRQYFETVGYVHHLVEGLNDVFDVELGVGLSQQELNDQDREDSTVLRVGFDYLHEFEGGNRFDADLLVLDGADNTYSQFRTSLKTRLVGNVGVEFGQTIQRNSQVDIGKKNTDTTTNVGLVYQF